MVTEAFDWQHGTFLGATAGSETTAAAAGKVGKLRRDPMAMLPFCGYHMGDYFRHWLNIGSRGKEDKLPKIFFVNWFRQNSAGDFLWPGFGENSRVLKWIVQRVNGKAEAVDTPIGRLPAPGSLDLTGLNIDPEVMDELLRIDVAGWLEEVRFVSEHFDQFGDRLPEELRHELTELESRMMEVKG